TGSLDLLVCGTLDTATADAPRESPVTAHEQCRTLRPGRRPERPHHDRACRAGCHRGPCIELTDEVLHRSDAPTRAPWSISRACARSSRLARSCDGRNTSMWGHAAA